MWGFSVVPAQQAFRGLRCRTAGAQNGQGNGDMKGEKQQLRKRFGRGTAKAEARGGKGFGCRGASRLRLGWLLCEVQHEITMGRGSVFLNGFIEIIRPSKADSSMIFSVFTEWCNFQPDHF